MSQEQIWTCSKCLFINSEPILSSERACEICGEKASKQPVEEKLKAFPKVSSKMTSKIRRKPKKLKSQMNQQSSILSFIKKPKSELENKGNGKSLTAVAKSAMGTELLGFAERSLSNKNSLQLLIHDNNDNNRKRENKTAIGCQKPKKKMSIRTKSNNVESEGINRLMYADLCVVLKEVSATTKRLKKHAAFLNFFRRVMKEHPEDLTQAVFLATDAISPDYEKAELGIGYRLITSMILDSTGAKKSQLSANYRSDGDLGDAAFKLKSSQKTLFGSRPLTVREVYDTLCSIPAEVGNGSNDRKKKKLMKLFRACKGEEVRFFVRFLQRNSRIGTSRISIIDALAHASEWHHYELRLADDTGAKGKPSSSSLSNAADILRQHYYIRPDFRLLIQSIIDGGVERAQNQCVPKVGIPILPMLAKVCHSVSEFMEAFKDTSYTCEYKYDGQRIQVHFCRTGKSSTFSRHCLNNSEQFPDVIEFVRLVAKPNVCTCVLDAEVVAIDPTKGNTILPFQTLSTRGRKEVVADNVNVRVCLFVFDILELNGESLLNRTLEERRTKLKENFSVEPGKFELVAQYDVNVEKSAGGDIDSKTQKSAVDVEGKLFRFLQKALNSSCEGVMVKSLKSSYIPHKRSDRWIKLKQDYIQSLGPDGTKLLGGGLGDSLDLVPIGGWHGNGRKSKFISPFLLACYDPISDMYFSVCRCMSGFSDEFYKEQNKTYVEDRELLKRKPFNYVTPETPAFWFEPIQCWEIRGAELTISPRHMAAQGMIDGHPNKGISVRFPRFVRNRSDKPPHSATTPQQLAEMFYKQTRRIQ